MSVVTRWRNVPSSSVTQLTVIPGLACSKCPVSFCISIMWPLFTVAIVSSPAWDAGPYATDAATAATASFTCFFISFSLSPHVCELLKLRETK